MVLSLGPHPVVGMRDGRRRGAMPFVTCQHRVLDTVGPLQRVQTDAGRADNAECDH